MKKKLLAFSVLVFALLAVVIIAVLLAARPNQSQNPNQTPVEEMPEEVKEEEETPIEEENEPELPEINKSIILPAFDISTIVGGLTNPWDIDFLPDGTIIFTERANKLNVFKDGSIVQTITFEDAFVRGEGGVLGLAVDPEFNSNKFIYVCLNSTLGNNPEIRVARLKLNAAFNIEQRTDIITGMTSASGGRHSGCQLEFGNDGYLWVGTGDAAIGTIPQDPQNLGGKILRVTRDGGAIEGNLGSPFDSRIYSYGHRNTQGLVFFPTSLGFAFEGVSIEQGPNINDEINLLFPGNFGWNPVPDYNESVPMTDLLLYPNAFPAAFESGTRTFALSGGTVLVGSVWGDLQGTVVAAALKDEKLTFVKLDRTGNFLSTINAFEGQFGRIRTAQLGPDSALYILTDKGGNDSIIRMMPK